MRCVGKSLTLASRMMVIKTIAFIRPVLARVVAPVLLLEGVAMGLGFSVDPMTGHTSAQMEPLWSRSPLEQSALNLPTRLPSPETATMLEKRIQRMKKTFKNLPRATAATLKSLHKMKKTFKNLPRATAATLKSLHRVAAATLKSLRVDLKMEKTMGRWSNSVSSTPVPP